MQAQYRLMYQAHARLPIFRRHVDEAKWTLEEFLAQCQAPYVSFSGGKDSTAVLILLSQMGLLDIPIATQSDDLDFPDMGAHCRNVVEQLGFRDYTHARSALEVAAQLAAGNEQLQETFFYDLNAFAMERQRTGCIMGLRAEESWQRRRLIRKFGSIYERARKGGEGKELCCLPLHNWSGEDVFALILTTETPYMHVYDKDDERMPHEIRFSWMVNPQFFNRGDVAYLRRYYPDHYNRLASRAPELARYT